MKRLIIPGLLSLMMLLQRAVATDAVYVNNGDITFPPQIDAITVINNGLFDIFTELPFDTSNTQNFTNNGTMFGSVGFRFDNAPSSSGYRKPSANFRNRLTGLIQVEDGGGFFVSINNQISSATLLSPSFLLVSATNILNEGNLIAGSGGLMQLVGTNVNLARSGLLINPIEGRGSENGVATNFFTPDLGIYDYYWAQTNQTMNSANIIQAGGDLIVSPRHFVTFHGGRAGSRTLQVFNPVGDFYTNTVSMTNILYTNDMGMAVSTNVPSTNVVQAVFVGLPNGIQGWDVRFSPSEDFQNPMMTASVRLSFSTTNVVTAGNDLVELYLVDTLASATNRGFYTNLTSTFDLRPQNYLISRIPPDEYFNGTSPGNGPPFPTNLLYLSDFVSKTATNEYAAYADSVDSIASRPPNIIAGTVTNFPGRVEIVAEDLDVSRTRIRANGLLSIKAKNVLSATNMVVDCENLSYVLGSTNGKLNVQGLARQSASRVQGTNYVWSGLWTNYQNMVISNFVQDTVNTNLYVPAPLTNVVEYRIYAMIFDASQMTTEVPVTVDALVTHSTNVVINDSMTVVQSLLFDGISLTLNGTLSLSNKIFFSQGGTMVVSLDSWVGTNAPNLKFLTNNGTFNIPNEGHFGDDLASPYSAFVNNGSINAFGQTIKSDYVEINGQNNAAANISIFANSAKIQGSLSTGGDVAFFIGDLRLLHASISTGSRLDLTVTNTLSDAGGSSGNAFSVNDGFRLLRKPAFGDLLGSSINSIAPEFAEVDHVWAVTDLGPTAAGFQNNVALGKLILTPGDFEANFPPLFFFAGTGGGNALYVDQLDLSHLSDFQNEIEINPDLVIYYASAKLSFTPPMTNGAAQLPEEYLDGQFNGHLRWVRDFSGPNSSVAVIVNGVSVLVNRALRESLIIDSDGDGIPNGLDFFPFDTSLLAKLAMIKPPMTAVLSWNAQAHKVYSIEAATNYILPDWQRITYYTNSANTNGTVTIQIPVPPGSPRQFYRVGTTN